MARPSFFAGTVFLACSAVACTQQSSPMLSPTAPSAGLDAASDGTTLKVSAPTLVAPTGGVQLDTLEPEFVIGAASARHSANAPGFEYQVEVQTMQGQTYVSSPKLAGAGQLRWKTSVPLLLDQPYRWRARVELNGRVGPWSEYADFRSLNYRGLVPRPPNGVWPNNGPAVIDYIAEHFDDYLHPTGSLAERIEHMEFLRDRVIEAGVCGGVDLALNLKRGVGPHSHDAIAWRKPNGFVEVVDIASAFDDNRIFMRLHWQIVSGPSGYDPLPNHPGC